MSDTHSDFSTNSAHQKSNHGVHSVFKRERIVKEEGEEEVTMVVTMLGLKMTMEVMDPGEVETAVVVERVAGEVEMAGVVVEVVGDVEEVEEIVEMVGEIEDVSRTSN